MLEDVYKDEQWNSLVKLAEEVDNDEIYTLLPNLKFNKDLARVIYFIEGNIKDSVFYINYEIPALGGLKPVDCLDDENLLKRLKVVLIRWYAKSR